VKSPPGPESAGKAPPGGFLGRFLVSGAANTLATYALYLVLLNPLGHRLGYSLAFAAGVVLAYGLNRGYVFRSHAGWRSVIAVPLIYILQYVLGLGIVEAWVSWLALPAALAPLAAIGLTLPLTYLLSKKSFLGINPCAGRR
jgi:putative flippase GtrA